MRLTEIRENIKAQEEGEWRDLGDADGDLAGVEVCIRSTRSEIYEKRIRTLQNRIKVRGSQKAGNLFQKTADAEREALDTLVAGWRHIEDAAGKEIPYTSELARDWASDRHYRKFYDAVFTLAREIGLSETEAREEALGNSESGSSTPSEPPTRPKRSARPERTGASVS